MNDLLVTDSGFLRWFGQVVRRTMATWQVPGCAVGITQGDRTLYAKGFGYRDLKRGLAVTESTLFGIGSCTKAFTATAVGILVEEGKLAWDRPIRECLPGFRMSDPEATKRATVRDLLTHMTGLPRYDYAGGCSEIDPPELVRRLRHLPASRGFREEWQYSNLNYIIAGALIERVSGETWEEFVRRRIFDPVEMAASRSGTEMEWPAERYIDADISLEYAARRGKAVPLFGAWARGLDLSRRFAPGVAGAGLVSNIPDMCRWLRVQLNGARSSALQEPHSPQVEAHWGGLLGPEASDTRYGMGWFIQKYRGHRCVSHGGTWGGYRAKVSFLPDSDLGVVVLANMCSTPLCLIVTHFLLDRFLDSGRAQWNGRLRRKGTAGSGPRAKSPRRRSNAARSLADYVGDYVHPGYNPLRIRLVESRLEMRYTSYRFRLRPTGGDAFESSLRIPDPELFPEFWRQRTVMFRSGPDGTVRSVGVPFEPAVGPTEFRRAE